MSARNLDPELIASVVKHPGGNQLLQSLLRVRVVGGRAQGPEELPDVFGQHHAAGAEIAFLPHFPFEAGVDYRATFDPRPLGRAELAEVLTLDFALPAKRRAAPTRVSQVFPSGGSLPENLLRFYVRFSHAMQRGRAEEQIRLLGPDGQPAADVLYRPPIELWDRSMRCLTVLLDPGRLKRGVGPNLELGPPLKAGAKYTLIIGSGQADAFGRPLREDFRKLFRVTPPVREPIAVEDWEIRLPSVKSHHALALMFPRPLDFALLRHAITIATEGGRPVHGRITIDRCETRWCFTPASPWAAGWSFIRVAPGLEDVCGNNLAGAFDRPLRPPRAAAVEAESCLIPFHLG